MLCGGAYYSGKGTANRSVRRVSRTAASAGSSSQPGADRCDVGYLVELDCASAVAGTVSVTLRSDLVGVGAAEAHLVQRVLPS
jgi:hypothetical protein